MLSSSLLYPYPTTNSNAIPPQVPLWVIYTLYMSVPREAPSRAMQ